jgi:hypothetical protein
MVAYVVRYNPWLNIEQITEQLIKLKPKWKEMTAIYGKENQRELPRGKPTRKTAGRGLRQLFDAGEVVAVGGLFASTYDYVKKHSRELNQSVRRLLKSPDFDKWNFAHAGPVAACYAFSKPDGSHRKFRDILDQHGDRFRDSFFWIDDILAYGLMMEWLPPSVYSEKTKRIDTHVLRDGWKRIFGDTGLFVFATAISPPEFLEFLVSSTGQTLLERRLETNWNHIVDRAERDREKLGVGRIEEGN